MLSKRRSRSRTFCINRAPRADGFAPAFADCNLKHLVRVLPRRMTGISIIAVFINIQWRYRLVIWNSVDPVPGLRDASDLPCACEPPHDCWDDTRVPSNRAGYLRDCQLAPFSASSIVCRTLNLFVYSCLPPIPKILNDSDGRSFSDSFCPIHSCPPLRRATLVPLADKVDVQIGPGEIPLFCDNSRRTFWSPATAHDIGTVKGAGGFHAPCRNTLGWKAYKRRRDA